MTEPREAQVQDLEARFHQGDVRALARALTLVESGHPLGQALLKRLRGRGRAKVVGITGSPGAGKSTLTDRLILEARKRGERVGVLAVDPSSPFTGGAILGDRIRMMRHHQDPGVYIRSLASRGALGGLAGATVAALSLLEAFGFDRIFVETVGVGQSEVDIARVADTTLLVLTPAAGDAVQAFKAGVMEIADLFAVNKFDLPGGERIIQELKSALELSPPRPGGWRPPIYPTVAATGEGVEALFTGLEAHHQHLLAHGLLEDHRLERARFEVESVIQEWGRRRTREGLELVARVAQGDLSPEEAAMALLDPKGGT
ncbi:MAG: methylmalonyl Co-A mutase-associated GTPase MeaB [Thermus sp.]|uniref:methylmalonyl Co-A mutase-associated GTPase MeaB n=1 Tax=Thermus sp. TaxID=275 RepID=UPI0025DAE087|nr:methylmalonyl Co-A mutase-associated GTPase MeaB [Thermus sp.]MCS6868640.1 methylmalonyl Co-A mutase-associated GTPase MeaB [Thermus sp.]MCS7218248.1 methylmalonyl Co-A mutase-associated GTPase MeaB [Thermus sp.]MDW8017039.1 methylmalonyl Co-A mutase-associated GTPase MeaB [Thermus sp.]MDW8356309.1 methylmalonyl Co-A mutase-associated GTPase MeaB [Thermus sp.]